ncbi:phage holin family protein [Paenibacillus sp. NPDC057967]|uniref:phage holin family protein n=1 Tax=Paenibacillus sp. NPDC057967 TaxID=3346293 RepID=UPI0036DC6FC5
MKNTPKVSDWTFPWLLLVLGIASGILLVGDLLQGTIQGVLVTGTTVLAHQLVKPNIKSMGTTKPAVHCGPRAFFIL